jgi:pimeloyl-ACP methyl ester carboxylesterase
MPIAAEVDGFRLVYDEHGAGGEPVVLLHGWPGDRHDHRLVVPLLVDRHVLVPDLRGFGETGAHAAEPSAYAADAQARSVVALVETVGPAVLAGYDVGSRVAQAVAAARPDLVRRLVISPPVPGAGRRVLDPGSVEQFWYQSFHQLALAERLIDGHRDAARAYLEHFWTHWSGPDYVPEKAELDRLADGYGRPGAFVASINWYRAGAGTVARSVAEQAPERKIGPPTLVLWPEHDPLFPRAWSDRAGEFFADVTVRPVDGAGHFVPLEAPEAFAEAILRG